MHGCVIAMYFYRLQVKDMKERLEEAESMGVRRMKAQMQAMEGRVASLEEQLDAATRSESECIQYEVLTEWFNCLSLCSYICI